MELEYSVIEIVTRLDGQINEISYNIEESALENVQLGMALKKERCTRVYQANITRDQYNRLARQAQDALAFEDFICVFRPFMMGFYEDFELEQAFAILDKDGSGSIHVSELSTFLPLINAYATGDTLRAYLRKIDMDVDDNLTYDEFRSLVLKGIGRDILCSAT